MTKPRIKTGKREEVTVLCRLIGALCDARARHANALTVLPISPEWVEQPTSQTSVGSRDGSTLAQGAHMSDKIANGPFASSVTRWGDGWLRCVAAGSFPPPDGESDSVCGATSLRRT